MACDSFTKAVTLELVAVDGSSSCPQWRDREGDLLDSILAASALRCPRLLEYLVLPKRMRFSSFCCGALSSSCCRSDPDVCVKPGMSLLASVLRAHLTRTRSLRWPLSPTATRRPRPAWHVTALLRLSPSSWLPLMAAALVHDGQRTGWMGGSARMIHHRSGQRVHEGGGLRV